MEKHPTVHVGGDIESALKGDYKINILAILKEAWQLTLTSRKELNLGLLYVLMLGFLLVILLSQAFGGVAVLQEDEAAMFIINAIVTIVLAPFIAGVEMMGVFKSVGLKIHPRMVGSFLKHTSYISLCAIFSAFLVSIGFQLLILPGVYLLLAFTLTMPLIIEKKLSPIKAMIISIKVTRFQWFQIFSLYGVLFLALLAILTPIALLVSSPAGIVALVFFFVAMSYLAPMFYYVKGILYREIFGLHLHMVDKDMVVNSTFTA